MVRKIFTYFHDFKNCDKERKLVDFWLKNWKSNDFDAAVLSLDDAKAHPFFDEFNEKMTEITSTILHQPLSPYGWSCWHRWLSYAALPIDDCVIVCDYDILNSSLWYPGRKLSDKLHFMDSDCPCVSSGTPKQFDKLIRGFIDLPLNNIDFIKSRKKLYPHFHDQEFFNSFCKDIANPDSFQDVLTEYDLLLTRNTQEDVSPFRFQSSKPLCYHISHQNTQMIFKLNLKEFTSLDIQDLRLELFKLASSSYDNFKEVTSYA
jgi:hypothetical protein